MLQRISIIDFVTRNLSWMSNNDTNELNGSKPSHKIIDRFKKYHIM